MTGYRAWQEGIPDDTKSGGPWFVSVPDGGDIEIGYDARGLPDEYHARLFAAAESMARALHAILEIDHHGFAVSPMPSILRKQAQAALDVGLPTAEDVRGILTVVGGVPE